MFQVWNLIVHLNLYFDAAENTLNKLEFEISTKEHDFLQFNHCLSRSFTIDTPENKLQLAVEDTFRILHWNWYWK